MQIKQPVYINHYLFIKYKIVISLGPQKIRSYNSSIVDRLYIYATLNSINRINAKLKHLQFTIYIIKWHYMTIIAVTWVLVTIGTKPFISP